MRVVRRQVPLIARYRRVLRQLYTALELWECELGHDEPSGAPALARQR
jgi:hypothetical protein